MKRFSIIVFLTLIIFTCACSKQSKSDLKLYVIPRNDLSDSMSDKEKVKAITSLGRLAFDGNDIEGYNWASHTITLYESSVTSYGNITKESGGSSIFKTDDSYAFALIIKDKLIYIGGFEHGSKNPDIPLQPSIRDNDKYSFKIVFDAKYSKNSDNRSNNTLYNFLNSNGMLISKA